MLTKRPVFSYIPNRQFKYNSNHGSVSLDVPLPELPEQSECGTKFPSLSSNSLSGTTLGFTNNSLTGSVMCQTFHSTVARPRLLPIDY